MPVQWNAENDRKLLLNMITNLSSKDVDTEALALLFPGATSKAIHERIGKLRRETKAVSGPTPPAPAPATNAPKRGRRSKAEIEAANAAAHGDAESGADLAADLATAAAAEGGEADAPAKRGRGKAGKNVQGAVDDGVEEERGRKRKRDFEVGGGGEGGMGEEEAKTVEVPTKRGRGRPKGGKGVVVKKEVGNGEDEAEEGVLRDGLVDAKMAGAEE